MTDPAQSMAAMDEAELRQDVDTKPGTTTTEKTAATKAMIVVVPEDESFTEDEIIRRKLMFDGDGGGDDRRLNLLMKTFFSWCRMDAGSQKDQVYHKMMYMMDDAQLSMRKAQLVQQMNERELEKYDSLIHELDERIEEAKCDISRVKEDLQNAKNVRKNRMQYDPIVAQIKELPSRKESIDKIDKIKIQAKILTGRIEDLDERIEKRRQQFQQLSDLAQDLFTKLNQDEALALEDLPDETLVEGPVEPHAGSKRKTFSQ